MRGGYAVDREMIFAGLSIYTGPLAFSNYNARPRPPELLVDGDAVHVIRERETISELFAREHLIGAN